MSKPIAVFYFIDYFKQWRSFEFNCLNSWNLAFQFLLNFLVSLFQMSSCCFNDTKYYEKTIIFVKDFIPDFSRNKQKRETFLNNNLFYYYYWKLLNTNSKIKFY